MNIVGTYKIEKMMYSINNDFNLYTKDEICNDIDYKLKNRIITVEEANQTRKLLESIFEFTEDKKIYVHVNSSSIDGESLLDESIWKTEKGKYYYNSNNTDDKSSNWIEILEDEDNNLLYLYGMIKLKRID